MYHSEKKKGILFLTQLPHTSEIKSGIGGIRCNVPLTLISLVHYLCQIISFVLTVVSISSKLVGKSD